MGDHKLQILLDAKNTSQAAFLSAGNSLESYRMKTEAAFTKMGGFAKSFASKIFSVQGALAGAAGVAGFGLFIDKSLKAADVIGKTADRIGISTGALQQYRYAAGLSGVETASLDKGLEKFGKTLGETKAGTGALTTFLKKYDETLLENIKNAKSTDQALDLIFDAMGKASSQADRAALANAAFGKSGIAMTVMLKNGVGGLKAMKQEAKDLGMVIGDDLIRQSEKANDEVSKLVQVVKVQFMSAAVGLAPEIAKIAQQTTDWWKANQNLVKSDVREALTNIKTGIVEIKEIYESMPEGVIGAAGYGIIGRVLFGAWGPAKAIAVISLLNDQMSKLSLLKDFTFEAQIDYAKQFNEASWNIWDVATGKKDWQTGADIGGGGGIKYFPIPEDTLSKFDTGFDMDFYNAELEKYSAKVTKTNEAAAKATAKTWKVEYFDKNQDYYKDSQKDYQKYIDSLAKGGKELTAADEARLESQIRYEKYVLRQRTLQYGGFFDGIKVGINDVQDGFSTWAQTGYDTFSLIKNSGEDLVFAYFTGRIDDIGDIWDNMWQGALRIFINTLEQMAIKWAASGIANLFGFNIGSGGGLSLTSALGLASSGGGGSPISGGGILTKLGGLFGSGAAIQTTGIATTGSLTTSGGAAYSAVSGAGTTAGSGALAAAAPYLAAGGIAAIAISGYMARANRQQMAPGPYQWLKAWSDNAEYVPGFQNWDSGHGGYGWQSLITQKHIEDWLRMSIYGSMNKYGAVPSELTDAYWSRHPESVMGDIDPGRPEVWMLRNYPGLYASGYEDLTAHAIGGSIDKVIRPVGVRIPAGDDGLVSAQIGEVILSKDDIKSLISDGHQNVRIDLRLYIDSKEIGYTVADQAGKNIQLIEAIRRAVR